MSSAITKHQEVASALAPRSFDDVLRFAEMLAKSDMVPKDYKGKPGNIMAAVQMGAELGLAPMQSLQNIAVINGRPGVWGDALLALVQAHPECEDVIEEKPTSTTPAVCTVKRRGRSPVTQTFSVEDAKRARLWGKQGPWTEYPQRMLQLRARAFALRDSFADVLRGIGMAEELQDIPAKASGRVSVIDRGSTPDTAADARNEASPALPPHNPETGEVIDAEIDPFDYVITFGKNQGKALRELANNQLHWYAEEFKPRNDEGEKVKRYARMVIDARKLERELERAAEAKKASTDANEDWGMGAPDEPGREDDEADDPAHEHES
jgi:uncharacterized protein (DUF3820 family)